MSWFKTGYEAVDTAYDDMPTSGPRRVWMPSGVTNRFLFLDDDPCCFWEHQFEVNGDWRNFEPCKVRNNRMEDVCTICDRFPDRYPSFVGLHTVISLTPYTDKQGRTWCFGRQIYAAKMGSKDKPGVLKKLQRLKGRHGHIRGLVIDCFRSGDKTEVVGDELEVVERIDPDTVVAWVKAQLPEHLEIVNRGKEKGKEMTIEHLLKYNPIGSFNFEEVIKIRSNSQLLSMLGGPRVKTDTVADEVANQIDEDIPY